MRSINDILFTKSGNKSASVWTFWIFVIAYPISALVRGFASGWDFFEQLVLFLSFYSIIETARNSVITSLLDKDTK